MKNIRAESGEDVRSAAYRACVAASDGCCTVQMTHNDTVVTVKPGMYVDQVTQEWARLRAEAAESADKRYTLAEARRIFARQDEVAAVLRALAAQAESDGSGPYWFARWVGEGSTFAAELDAYVGSLIDAGWTPPS